MIERETTHHTAKRSTVESYFHYRFYASIRRELLLPHIDYIDCMNERKWMKKTSSSRDDNDGNNFFICAREYSWCLMLKAIFMFHFLEANSTKKLLPFYLFYLSFNQDANIVKIVIMEIRVNVIFQWNLSCFLDCMPNLTLFFFFITKKFSI